MTMTIGVVVATFGNEEWREIAHARALSSVLRQTVPPHRTLYAHGDTLAESRNAAAAKIGTDWLIFLDADDELAPDYIENVHRKLTMAPSADVMVPAVQYVHPDHDDEPRMIGPYPLRDMNYIVCGAPVRRCLFDMAGGFFEERAWEDWSLWLRVQHLGAELVSAPRAVYRAFVNPFSRNHVEHPQRLRREILSSFEIWAKEHPK